MVTLRSNLKLNTGGKGGMQMDKILCPSIKHDRFVMCKKQVEKPRLNDLC